MWGCVQGFLVDDYGRWPETQISLGPARYSVLEIELEEPDTVTATPSVPLLLSAFFIYRTRD